MKECPYCKGQMEPGFIGGESAPLYWIPEGKRDTMFRYHVPDAGIELNQNSTMRNKLFVYRYRSEAYYCKTCKLVIADTSC